MLLEWPQSALTEIASASEYIASKIDEVGVAEELDEARRVSSGSVERVLGIGRVDDDRAVALEAVAVRIAGMALPHRRDRMPAMSCGLAGLEVDELDRRR